jgi:hypothetical protein
MRDYQELQYTADMIAAMDLVKKWSEKSSNKEIETMTKLIINIAFYVNGLNVERKGFDMVVDEQQSIVRKLRKQIEELKEEIREMNMNNTMDRL